MREFKGTAKTNHEISVAYLWERADWGPTHELVKLSRPYGSSEVPETCEPVS